jgi:uncharacterized damage-inducible protein DinB
MEFEELLAYSEEERSKWEGWFRANPHEAFRTPVQTQGRFPNAWHLLHHIFLVEMRHTQRLENDYPVMESAGVAEGDLEGLFDFARKTRARFKAFVQSTSDEVWQTRRRLKLRDTEYEITPRKLVFHVLLHETRHWAQLAVAVRNAGHEPPGNHDLFFSKAMS